MIPHLGMYSTESLIKELEKRELARLEKLKSEISEIQEDFRVQCEAFTELMKWFDKNTCTV